MSGLLSLMFTSWEKVIVLNVNRTIDKIVRVFNKKWDLISFHTLIPLYFVLMIYFVLIKSPLEIKANERVFHFSLIFIIIFLLCSFISLTLNSHSNLTYIFKLYPLKLGIDIIAIKQTRCLFYYYDNNPLPIIFILYLVLRLTD